MAPRSIAFVMAFLLAWSGFWGCSFVEEIILDQRHSHQQQQQHATQPQQSAQSQTTSDPTHDSSSGIAHRLTDGCSDVAKLCHVHVDGLFLGRWILVGSRTVSTR